MNGRHSEGISLPSLEVVNAKTGPITYAIHELKRAVEAHDEAAFKNCIVKIQNNMTDLIELFRPSQVRFIFVVYYNIISDVSLLLLNNFVNFVNFSVFSRSRLINIFHLLETVVSFSLLSGIVSRAVVFRLDRSQAQYRQTDERWSSLPF